MTDPIDAVVSAFAALHSAPQPLELNRGILIERGKWNVSAWGVDEPIPAEEIIAAFERHGELRDGGRVLVPLHEYETAELSGNYLVYRPNERGEKVHYYDLERGDLTPIRLNILGNTLPGYLLRFWHPEFTPPSPPSYIESGSTTLWGTTDGLSPTQTSLEPLASVEETEANRLFDDLETAVEANRDAARTKIRDEYEEKGARQFAREDRGVTNFVSRGRPSTEKQTLWLGTERGDEKLDIRDHGIFKRMDIVVDANGGNSQTGFPFDARVTDIWENSIGLQPKWETSDNPAAAVTYLKRNDGYVSVAELLNPVPFDRQLEAIETIRSLPTKGKRGVITGRRPLRFGSRLGALITIDEPPLNEYQRLAAEDALRTGDIFCIHGPPGTGKSRTSRVLIREAVKNGLRVLVCSQSNPGLDHLIAGTSELDDPDPDSLHAAVLDSELTIAREGRGAENEVVIEHHTGIDRARADVVATTTNGAARLHEEKFDLAVIDEAAQASIPESLIPFVCSRRLVLVGDHKQLPPFSPKQANRAGGEMLNRSLFEYVLDTYGEDASQLLQRQYRMNRVIAEFSARGFYDGALTHDTRNEDWTINGLEPLVGIDLRGEERKDGTSSYNETEAECVAKRVQLLLKEEVDPAQIGVIAMYGAQCRAIHQQLNRAGITDIEVSTVDSFQGSEREVIIVSFVRSNRANETGFLTRPGDGPRRLNVAMTRAQKRLELVGDWDTLRTSESGRNPANDRSDLYNALYMYLEERGKMISQSKPAPSP